MSTSRESTSLKVTA